MRIYDEEFKRNAVTMLVMSNKTLVQVSSELGVSKGALEKWKKKYKTELDSNYKQSSGGMKPSDIIEENRQLRKELARVTWQRDILKKATSILSERPLGGMQ